MSPPRTKVIGVLVAAFMLAGSCSGDDDGSSKSIEAPVGATSSGEPAEGSAGDNSASFRGVTEDTIKVGVTVPDFDALQQAGIQQYFGDYDVVYQAFIDAINDDGGVNGRMLEPVYAPFDYLTAVTQEQACIELTEDNEVFIVLNGLLSESNLCLTAQHDTMVITNEFQSAELRESSGETVWLSVSPSTDAATEILGSTVAESGRLDGKTIGVLANGGLDGGSAGEVMKETLAEYGFDSRVVVMTSSLNDPTEQRAEIAVIAEQFVSAGVDFVFDLLGGGNATGLMALSGFEAEMAASSLEGVVSGASDASLLDGAIGVAAPSNEDLLADPEFNEKCVDVVLEANPDLASEFETVPTGNDQANGQKNWFSTVRFACSQTTLLKALLEIAGADLTNDSFRAALDELGPIELPGYGLSTFNSVDKWDGLNEFTLQEYDAESETVVSIGDSIILDR